VAFAIACRVRVGVSEYSRTGKNGLRVTSVKIGPE
jgi:hypothetical protein